MDYIQQSYPLTVEVSLCRTQFRLSATADSGNPLPWNGLSQKDARRATFRHALYQRIPHGLCRQFEGNMDAAWLPLKDMNDNGIRTGHGHFISCLTTDRYLLENENHSGAEP